jgi:uncharacterized protein with PIN domain
MITLETKTEQNNIVIPEEELDRCRQCGKLFKPYKIQISGREFDSSFCKECRKKYS